MEFAFAAVFVYSDGDSEIGRNSRRDPTRPHGLQWGRAGARRLVGKKRGRGQRERGEEEEEKRKEKDTGSDIKEFCRFANFHSVDKSSVQNSSLALSAHLYITTLLTRHLQSIVKCIASAPII